MGGMGSVVKGQGAVGGLTSKVGHCGHGVRQRTSHAPGARPLQQSTSTTRNRSAGRSQGAAEKKLIAEDIRATALRSSSRATERRDGSEGSEQSALGEGPSVTLRE